MITLLLLTASSSSSSEPITNDSIASTTSTQSTQVNSGAKFVYHVSTGRSFFKGEELKEAKVIAKKAGDAFKATEDLANKLLAENNPESFDKKIPTTEKKVKQTLDLFKANIARIQKLIEIHKKRREKTQAKEVLSDGKSMQKLKLNLENGEKELQQLLVKIHEREEKIDDELEIENKRKSAETERSKKRLERRTLRNTTGTYSHKSVSVDKKKQ